jgi:hypothetical protein
MERNNYFRGRFLVNSVTSLTSYQNKFSLQQQFFSFFSIWNGGFYLWRTGVYGTLAESIEATKKMLTTPKLSQKIA